MDKQLLLTAARLTQFSLVPYIANTVRCWQHFSRLVPAVAGGSVEHGSMFNAVWYVWYGMYGVSTHYIG